MAGREARRNEERLHFKFLAQYFENLHPDVYNKAENFYVEVKRMNPSVSDCTKTVQFMSVVKPNVPVPRYYRNWKLKGNTPRQMVLEIPLYKLPVPASASLQTTTAIPSPPVSLQTITAIPSPPLPLMSETTYKHLIDEIERDPEMQKILNDFYPDEFKDDDMNECVFNDVHMSDQIVSLENELMNIS